MAVTLTSGTTFGSVVIQAFGGVVTGNNGAAGTVYLKKSSDPAAGGQLIIDNNSVTAATGTTLFNGDYVSDTAVGDVIIRSGANLKFGNPLSGIPITDINLITQGSWTNTATQTLTRGTVTFVATTTGRTIASNSQNWYNVTVNGTGGAWTTGTNETLAGSFILAAGTFTAPSGIFAVAKDFTKSGGIYTHNSGTLRFNGGANQSADLGGATYSTVNVAKTAATQTFTGTGFTATTFSVNAGLTTKFAIGTQVTTTNLTLNGSSGNVITLDSTGTLPLDTWKLNVGAGTQTVAWVAVKHSDASPGTTIAATNNCTNNGYNTNWDFGTVPTFDVATSNTANLAKVYARFNEAMDSTTATNTANWTLSGGLTVSAASLSGDKKLVTLTASGNVTLGTTTVTASSSIKSLVQRNLATTTLTIQSGSADGVTDANAVTLALSTDGNKSVIQKSSFQTSAPVGNQDVSYTLTVTAPGTTATTVDLQQLLEPGGSSQIYYGRGTTNISTSVTTSGGTPNQATVDIVGQNVGAFKDDVTIRAFVSGQERGAHFATVISVTPSPRCFYHADQRPVTQTVTIAPAIQGVQIDSPRTWAIDRDLHATLSTLLAHPAFASTTGSDGKTTRSFTPQSINGYTMSVIVVNTSNATDNMYNTNYSDRYDDSPSHPPGDPYSEPGQGTGNAGSTCKNCSSADSKAQPHSPQSIDPSDGEKKLDLVDLVIPGRGIDYMFRHTYRSFTYRAGLGPHDFGEGWTASYIDEFLLKDGSGSQSTSNIINYRDGMSGGLYVNGGANVWTAPDSNFTQMRINAGGDFEIREESGLTRIYYPFTTTTTPNTNGRLKALRDRNGNILSLRYESIDPNATVTGDNKYVLAYVVDSLGREIRYQYYADVSQTIGGRVVTITHPTANTAAYGRLAKVIDFKDNMTFAGSPTQAQDFSGQTRNRTIVLDYDAESNLVRCSQPVVSATPNGNDFPNGPTTRYAYTTTANRAGLTTTQWNALTTEQQNRLLHKLTQIWYPNEVGSTPGTDPATSDAAEAVTYQTDASNAFLGYVTAFTTGGTNGNGVPSGGTITYAYTDLRPTRGMGLNVVLDPTLLFNLDSLQVDITNRNGNQSRYIYGGGKTLHSYKVFTKGLRTGEPTSFDLTLTQNRDRFLTSRTMPESNRVDYTYYTGTDRNQQSNLVRRMQTPDATRGGDQSTIEEVSIHEPVYCRTALRITARGANMTSNGFTPPIADPVTRTMTDPYDASKTLNLRYLEREYYDYQESPMLASAATAIPNRFSSGYVSSSPIANLSVSPAVLATEVLLLQELGLPESSAGLTELRSRLSVAHIKLGLGDLNADNDTTPRVGGNVVRVARGSPVLISGSNQHALESTIETSGDLIDQTKSTDDGGTDEGTSGTRLQTVVTMVQYNSYAQVTKVIDPEANVVSSSYFPENDPDGDAITTPTPADGRTLGSTTGGYLKERIGDTTRSYFDQSGVDKSSATFNNNATNPAITDIKIALTYDDVGNAITSTNGRGIRTDSFVTENNRTVQTTRAASISGASTASPSDPLVGASIGALTAFAYKERRFFDYNGSLVLVQTEDRDNTSSVDGSGLGTLPSQATSTTPGLSSADAIGGDAYVDTLTLFDRLDQGIEERREIDSTKCLTTKFRWDGNEHTVLTVYPAGNAESAVYDERDLVFQSIRGTSTRPSAGLYAAGDPTAFNRPGGTGTVASTVTRNYDKNRNLTEFVDAADTDGNASNNSTIAGAGDKTVMTYDGFDRTKT
ncbi:MAG: hypothetical protein H0W83_08355, partial [Planctomycetes bacterium]|nr:hypothetical protein [Planctomycetota bacterium]